MDDETAIPKQTRRARFRFSIMTLLLLALVVAVSVVATQQYLAFRNSRPLKTAVEHYNSINQARYDEVVGDGKVPLTPEQVIAVLESDHELVTEAPPQVASIFRGIVKTKRIPNDVDFDFIPSSSRWLLGMEINREGARYRLNIRKIDQSDDNTK